MDFKDKVDYFERLEHNPNDPNPWQALFLDKSIPFNEKSKAAFLYDSGSRTRQYLLPMVRVMARLSIMIIQLLKIILPKRLSSPKLLHRCLYWGMKYWITPEANYLILRHFVLGTEVLKFVKDNVKGAEEMPMNPLRPKSLNDVKDNLFLEHDLNLFNFVIRLNRAINEKGLKVEKVMRPDFSAISTEEITFEPFRRGWTNFLDLATAIEIFTPVYQLFLTDNDFWRASNSLQFDEVIGIYAATILDAHDRLVALNNKHPMIPLPTLKAGFRLLLHGLSTEVLHALLVNLKKQQALNPVVE
ncbi:hypothetical protein QQ008_20700 [Fulvivirgaceae bacterium BMA10]|uniref:Uncharacterized protein n=1 Tax=Splendidivirga corallicola TaxID=3051826 RepID=A0ABT8KW50_9BACT|nr:hypothetical protein [Fulvivirgaceae bacterium BMA10]